MRRALFFAVLPLSVLHAVDVTGAVENPNQTYGRDVPYRLTGDTTFGWRTGTLGGDLDLNGHAFVMETGGGNHTVFSGVLSGSGSCEWRGGGVPQVAPLRLTGPRANTFRGTFTLARGVLDLDKPDGVDAVPGDLVIGAKGPAVVRLGHAQQIADAARVTFAGPGPAGLELQGHDEAFAGLVLATHATLSLGDQPVKFRVGDCRECAWDLTKTLTIRGYRPGRDVLGVGGLTPAQLARIGFAGDDGLRRAQLDAAGALTPGALVEPLNPPFDLSPAAVAARAQLYEVDGLPTLTGPASPLREGSTLDFFGDSITWQHGFVGALDRALAPRKVKVVNRGINGGGVLTLRDGAKDGGYPGRSAQAPFADLLASDKADVAVVFIGINDVWWRNTPPAVFESALRELAAAAKARGTALVLATLTVRGELPDGRNPDDAKIEQFAELTRQVARATGATLVDLRAAYVAYLRNHNAQLRVDGSVYCAPTGSLTYDGVHPNAAGVKLLTNLLSDGLVRALRPTAP